MRFLTLSRAPQVLRSCWSPLAARMVQIRRRPLLVNLRTVLDRIPFKPLDVNCLYFLEYSGIPPQHAHLLRGRAQVRTATLDDLEGLTKCQNTPRAFLKRFEAKDRCAVAVLDGEIVGYQWFCDKPIYVEERYSYEIEIPPGAIYAYDIFILPEHRLAGLWFKFHCVYLRELMKASGRQGIIGMVDYGNRLSMNTHLRFGFRLVRKAVVAKILGKAFILNRSDRDEKVPLPAWVIAADRGAPRPDERPGPSPAQAVRPEPVIASAPTTGAPS